MFSVNINIIYDSLGKQKKNDYIRNNMQDYLLQGISIEFMNM